MEHLPLNFISPKQLNTVDSAQQITPEPWTEASSGETLELDTGDWTINAGSLKAKIDHWEVNEEMHQMQIISEEKPEGFTSLDYVFAVSMIGQIGSKSHLVSYLASLGEIYRMQPASDPDEPEERSEDEQAPDTN